MAAFHDASLVLAIEWDDIKSVPGAAGRGRGRKGSRLTRQRSLAHALAPCQWVGRKQLAFGGQQHLASHSRLFPRLTRSS